MGSETIVCRRQAKLTGTGGITLRNSHSVLFLVNNIPSGQTGTGLMSGRLSQSALVPSGHTEVFPGALSRSSLTLASERMLAEQIHPIVFFLYVSR